MKESIMKSNKNLAATCLNQTVSLMNLYQMSSVKLIDLIFTHNKRAMESSRLHVSELINLKDYGEANKLIAKNVTSKIKEYTNFATSAYLLGGETQSNLMALCQSHVNDHTHIGEQALKSLADSENPIASMAVSIAQSAFDVSKNAITAAKTSSRF